MKKEKIVECRDDCDIITLLEMMRAGALVVSEQRVTLYSAVINKFRTNRLRQFCNENFVLLVVGLLLAASCIVSIITGYDSNLVLFYVCCIINLVLCLFVVGRSMRKLEYWLHLETGILRRVLDRYEDMKNE